MHGDQDIGTTSSLGLRLKGIIENKDYSISEAIAASGEAILIVAKKHGYLRGSKDRLKTFSPPVFGRQEEDFSSQKLQAYLEKVLKAAAEFESANHLRDDLLPPPPPSYDSKTLDKVLEERFISYAFKLLHKGDFDSLRSLLESGANPDSRYAIGRSLLHQVGHPNYETLLELMLEKNADIDLRDGENVSPLILACHLNETKSAEILIRNNANVDLQDISGWSALMKTSFRGNIDVAKSLIKKGANPNLKSSAGISALFLAAVEGHNEIAEFLIQNKAEVNVTNHEGVTILIMAAFHGNIELAKILLRNKADASPKDNQNFTALDYLIQYHETKLDPELLELMLQAGADPNTQDPDGTALLMRQVVLENSANAKILIEHGANIDLSYNGDSLLHRVVLAGDPELTRLLLERGANPHLRNHQGLTPLDMALDRYYLDGQERNKKLLHTLVDHSQSLHEDISDSRLLQLVLKGQTGLLEYLLDRGANANSLDSFGASLLMAAASNGNLEITKLLLKHGANPEHKASGGYTVLGEAQRSQNKEVLDLITQEIAKCQDEKL
ncbi:MAG: hypothetical protein FJX34_05295, partial [Alphaproteobacteria bacterium]|nr:hypothetical protein [Alphaproteobacteria bacterium]